MKGLITILLVFLGFSSNAQDFLHFENGTTQEVKIFLLDKEKDIIGYIINNETKYRSISSLKSYQLNSVLDNSDAAILKDAADINGKLARRYDGNGTKYRFGKWSLSTDIWNLIPFNSISIFSVEPEYEFNKHFSLKIPLRFRLKNYSYNKYYYSDSRDVESAYDETYVANEVPTADNFGSRYFANEKSTRFQLGVSPKFYPWGKSRDLFSMYLSPSLQYSTDNYNLNEYYYSLDTLTIMFWDGPKTQWIIEDKQSNTISSNYSVWSYELLIGGDIVFGERVNASIELGLNHITSTPNVFPNKEYISYFDVENMPINIPPDIYSYIRRNRFVFRVLLTYRFGGTLDTK